LAIRKTKEDVSTEASLMKSPALGSKIRKRRREIDKTLEQIAKETDLSIGFLSQVERGVSTPSLSSLCNIAGALGVSIDAFVNSPSHSGVVTRVGERETFSLGDVQRTYELLGRGFPGAKLNACLVHRPPGQVTEVMHNAGEEFVFVLEGKVLYEIEGERHLLGKGDSIHFQSDRPHRSSTVGDTTVIELWVGTLPLFPDA
jgi:transcriptional regulator with XRE-family HTH domain